MIFVEHLTIPAGTTETSPKEVVIPILKGTITRVDVQFPPGVNALAHVKLLWGLYQLFPSNEQGDFSTGGETITWNENIAIDAEPLQLLMRAWNEDTVYDHTITVRIIMQPASGGNTVDQVVSQISSGG